MSDYRRNRVPGGTYFFTVNLLDRHCDPLIAKIKSLRAAVRQTHIRLPFHIDAWVVLPDHTHCRRRMDAYLMSGAGGPGPKVD